MSTITSLFEQAQLAEAAYANFWNASTNTVITAPDLVKTALIESGFSQSPDDPTQSAQATVFVSQWRVINHIPDTASGFSATLFERLDANEQPTGQYTLAIRGSTEFIDFAGADLSLATGGVAFDQLLSMVNYVLRLQAGSNGTTQQVELVAGATAPSLTSNFVSGVGPGINPAQLTISGHSLGGFLGQVYQRLFGSTGVYTYNALGLTRPNAPIFDQLTNLLGLPPGSFSSGPGENLLVPGEPAQLIGTVQGKPQMRVFSEAQSTTIEPINTIPAHKIAPVTDSLAFYDLLAKLDSALNTTAPAIGIGKITDILQTASNKPALSLEAALDSLGKLFKDPSPSAPTFVPTATDNREQYFQNVFSLQDRMALYAGTLAVDSLATTSNAQLAGLAQGSEAIAYRYALKELNPFAIVGNNDIFSPHNANGELNLYSPVTGTGLTREYLADRAEMLGWKNLFYQRDGNVALRGGRTESYEFTDRSIKDDRTGLDLTLKVVGRNSLLISNPARIIFGSDSDETLVGSDIAAGDRLYGGGGDDTLQGNQGNDYLEGGRGNDTYVWNTGDGFDTILDTDGIGRLVVNGRSISGGIKAAQGDYVNAEKLALHFEGDPIAGGVLIVNGDLRIENFTSGDLGIVLNDQGSVAEIQPTVTTFQAPFAEGTGFGTDSPDHYIASAGSFFTAKGDDDLLEGQSFSFFDGFLGDAGDDVLIGRALVSFLGGGAGRDTILGGPGSDQLFGDFVSAEFAASTFTVDLFEFIESSDSEPRPHGRFANNLFSERPDNDLIFQGGYFEALRYVLGLDETTDLSIYYDDYLDGGDESDLVVGGYGSDVLFGGASHDSIDGDGFTPIIDTQEGFDDVWRDSIATLFGRPGDDYLDGGPGDDQLVDRDGGNDMLSGGDDNDVLTSYDPPSVESYVNYLFGGEGDDRLLSENLSANGFDVLVGGPGNDGLTVRSGSAQLEGGPGNDDYSIEYASATKVIINDYDVVTGGIDRLSLSPLVAPLIPTSPLSITRDEANLYLGFEGVQDRVTIENWFAANAYRIEHITFSGLEMTELGPKPFSQVYDIAAIESRFTRSTEGADFLWGTGGDDQILALVGNDTLTGNEGNDALEGGEGDDYLIGGIGNDALLGGAGSDTYVFNLGDGVDTIVDSGTTGTDTVAFGTGITPGSLSLGLGSLLIWVGSNGDAIHIEGFDPNDALTPGSIEQFSFADGTVLSHAELLASGFDLSGTAGDDVIVGTSVHDRIDGGAGNDPMFGGAGNDTYFFGHGSGQDVIQDFDTAGLDTDTVLIGADIAPADLAISQAGDFIAIVIDGTSDQLSIRWEPEQGYGIERVEFSGGTVWDAAALEAIARSGSNTAPTVANPLMDQAAQKDVLFGFQVPEDTFRDMDLGEILNYSAALANGDPLPPWLIFDAVSRKFSGKPAATDVGTITIRVTASDLAGMSATDEFQLIVSGGGEWHEMDMLGLDDCDIRDYDHGKRDDERHGKPHGRKHDDCNDDRPDHKGDRMVGCLTANVESKPRYDFEALAEEQERSEQHGEALNRQEIARRWQVVGRYASALANEHDEDARGGADCRLNDHSLLSGSISGGGFGYSGSTGAPHRVANLQTLQGLAEGFQRLHS